MPEGREFHTEGAAMLKPSEAKVVWTVSVCFDQLNLTALALLTVIPYLAVFF